MVKLSNIQIIINELPLKYNIFLWKGGFRFEESPEETARIS